MKVILTREVKGHGVEGDVIEASRWYANNYLFPQHLAVPVTPDSIKQLEARRDALMKQKAEEAKKSKAAPRATKIGEIKGGTVYPEYAGNNDGFYYKDSEAFDRQEGVCYIPEAEFEDEGQPDGGLDLNSRPGYTYQDFLDVCYGNKKLAHDVFDLVDWQCPETVVDELDADELAEYQITETDIMKASTPPSQALPSPSLAAQATVARGAVVQPGPSTPPTLGQER